MFLLHPAFLDLQVATTEPLRSSTVLTELPGRPFESSVSVKEESISLSSQKMSNSVCNPVLPVLTRIHSLRTVESAGTECSVSHEVLSGGSEVASADFIVVSAGFGVASAAFGVISAEFDVAPAGFVEISVGFVAASAGFDVVSAAFEVIFVGFDVASADFVVISIGFDVVSAGLDVLAVGFDILSMLSQGLVAFKTIENQ